MLFKLQKTGGWGGGGSVLTQHQSRDMEMDSQRNSRDGPSVLPSALLEISYFTGELQYVIFFNIISGLGKTMNSQDQFPAIHFPLLAGGVNWHTATNSFDLQR